jgi:NitT/TauT family transport system permease protein
MADLIKYPSGLIPSAMQCKGHLHWYQKIFASVLWRKCCLLGGLLLLWEFSAIYKNSPWLYPRLSATIMAFLQSLRDPEEGVLLYIGESLKTLLSGYAIGILAAALLCLLAVNRRWGRELLEMVSSGLAPLPAVAVMPLALMYFGVGYTAVIFVACFATVFPVAVSSFQGFRSASPTVLDVGRNMGLKGWRFTVHILLPVALPSIMSGLRNGFSNAFRALIAVEMVIGAAAGRGGLGWFVMINKNNLEIPKVFAGILSIMALGLLLEAVFLRLEKLTIKRWGMLQE